MKYISRIMENEILEASKNYPVIMVCGQRQIGKSAMLNHIKESNRRYVSFDELNARRLALKDPDLFFDTYKYPIIIDEFQKVPLILEKIKEIVDRLAIEGRNNNGLFWLTSSQKFKMIGNGVPYLMAAALAKTLKETLGEIQEESNEKNYN